jgi:alpha-galactosidase
VSGAVLPDETRWPSGFAALADSLKALSTPIGMGVYTSATSSTCVGRPASYMHEEVDAATWCAWGATTIKVDNCGGTKYPALNTSWIKLRAALDNCPHDVLLAVESCGGGECAQWIRHVGAQMYRTTADLQLYWGSVMINLDGNEKMAPLAGPGSWPDPDMMIVGHGVLSAAEERSHFAAWVVASAPLGLSFDLSRGVAHETLALLTNPEVLDIHADAAGVAGVRAGPANATGPECWARPLAAAGGNATAVLLFNRGDAPADVACAWADVAPHWPAGAEARVRDVWERADAGVFAGGYVARALPRHGSALVTATLVA